MSVFQQQQGLYLVRLEDVTAIGTGARLFLGTQQAAQNRELLLRSGVSRILCLGTPAFHREAEVVAVAAAVPSGDGDSDGRTNGTGCGTKSGTFEYLEIPILDLPSENLVERLDECVAFIQDGFLRLGRGVLVNCVFAQSRSAAVVVAYLMKQEGISLAQAVGRVLEAQPTVHINPGFEAQLSLYHGMGCNSAWVEAPGDPPAMAASRCGEEDSNAAQQLLRSAQAGATYRWFLFACRLRNGKGAGSLGGSDGVIPARRLEGKVPAGKRRFLREAVFRCKACGSYLFSESNVIDHLHAVVLAASDSTYASFARHGDGSSWLAARDAATASATGASAASPAACRGGKKNRHKTLSSRSDAATAKEGFPAAGGRCTSVFTEALEWVGLVKGSGGLCRGSFEGSSGRITCPGRKGNALGVCGSKLGAWNLDGTACSCGRMVKPALQFTLSRIERRRSPA